MSIEATEVGSLREEVARAIGRIQHRDNHAELMMVTDAAIAIVLDRAAGYVEEAGRLAQHRASQVACREIAPAIRALAEPTP